MPVSEMQYLEKLDHNDKEKVAYFIKLLLKQSKYQKLTEEISRRREEINQGESLSHDDLWEQLNV